MAMLPKLPDWTEKEMTEERKQELALKVPNQSILQSIPLIYKTESIISFNEPPYKVIVCSVDLTEIVSSISRYSYPKLDTLIKYSEAKFSPVSSEQTDYIQLATPSYYRNFEAGENSEFIADDLEGVYKESLDWRKKKSTAMEYLKKRLVSYPINSRNLSVKITWARDNFWMYCTSISPDSSYKRRQQMKHLSSDYDFMTKIEEPSKFAEQLGQDIGKQIELQRDLKVDYFDWQIESLIASKLGVQGSEVNEYFISVYHGPVFYLNADEIERLIQRYELGSGGIIPFVKRGKYKEQQEYRFLVKVSGYRPNKDLFFLRVSDGLRNMITPVENVLW